MKRSWNGMAANKHGIGEILAMECSRQHWVVFCIFLCSLALPIRCQNANTDNWQATERLLTAVRNGDVPAAIAALRAGANANADGTPETYNLPPLHLACALASPAHLHIVRLLLRTVRGYPAVTLFSVV